MVTLRYILWELLATFSFIALIITLLWFPEDVYRHWWDETPEDIKRDKKISQCILLFWVVWCIGVYFFRKEVMVNLIMGGR